MNHPASPAAAAVVIPIHCQRTEVLCGTTACFCGCSRCRIAAHADAPHAPASQRRVA